MKTTECQFHNNCGGFCETPEELTHNLCADCLEAERQADEEKAAIAELGKAIKFLDSCRTEADVATGAWADAREWIESAARKVVGIPDPRQQPEA